MKLTLVQHQSNPPETGLKSGNRGTSGDQPDLGLIYGSIAVVVLSGVYLGSRLFFGNAAETISGLTAARFPLCSFKAVTKIPCLSCGMTRAVIYFAHLEIGQSLCMNPLVCLVIIGVLGWGGYELITRVFKTRRIAVALAPTERKIIIGLSITILLLNWLCVILAGR